MYFRQFRIADMGCASYLIGSEGEAMVVDPQWRIEPYLRLAQKENLKIRTIIDTHLHADHVSGNRRLTAATGATIYLHEAAKATFNHTPLSNEQILTLGHINVKVLHSPGHTGESIMLLLNETDQPEIAPYLLSGDTLFVGDVGRPDFAGYTGAHQLYASLNTLLPGLPTATQLYPGHLAGSLCGRNLSKDHSSTLEVQLITNYPLQLQDESDFVDYLMHDIPPHPADFERIVDINRTGPALELPPLVELTNRELSLQLQAGAKLVDVRETAFYWGGHLAGALNVPVYSNQFGPNVATFIPAGTSLVLIAEDKEDAEEAAQLLANVGRTEVTGYLTSETLQTLELRSSHEVTAQELCQTADYAVLDVREPHEYQAGTAPGALNIPLRQLVSPEKIAEVKDFANQTSKPLALICNNGNRSSVAASWLEQLGMNSFNIAGGWVKCQDSFTKIGKTLITSY